MSVFNADSSLEAWTRALAEPTISPAGGSAAAVAGAMGASLVAMVAGLTLQRPQYVTAHADAHHIHEEAEQLRAELLELAYEDARVFTEFGKALGLPTGTEHERATRDATKRRVLIDGARVQLEIANRAASVAELGEHLVTMAPPSTAGDTATAIFLATATVRSAYWAAYSDLERDTDSGRSLLNQSEAAQQRMEDVLTKYLR